MLIASMKRCSFVLAALASTVGCGSSAGQSEGEPVEEPGDATELRAQLSELSPETLPAPPADLSNRFADDSRAAQFGQRLFYDNRFAGALLDSDNNGGHGTLGNQGEVGKVACADCHNPARGFSDHRSLRGQISLASGWGKRRARSLLDVGQSKLLMWDGRRDALYNQVFEPLENPLEMNSARLYVAKQLFKNHRAEYEALFGAMPPLDDAGRFPDIAPEKVGCNTLEANPECHGKPGDGAEFDGMTPADQQEVTRIVTNFGKALGAFERKLSCGQGRFDAWMHGDETAITEDEKKGAALFAGKGGCISCHGGPFLTDQTFHNLGLMPTTVALFFTDKDDPGAQAGLSAMIQDSLNVKGAFSDGDDGRIPGAVPEAALGAFRTPSLRCVTGRPSFMHTGQLRTMVDVMRFFARGGDGQGYLGISENHPRDLSDQEQQQMIAFLGTLEGPGPAAELLAPPP